MKLIASNEQLAALLPNIVVSVEGETPLISKLAPFLGSAEQWVSDAFTAETVFDTICSLAEEDRLRAATTQLVVFEAFRRAVPHLDVVLTPNGFGIVSNSNVAPASKERIQRLLDALLTNRDTALRQVLALLRSHDPWLRTSLAEFFRSTMFPDMEVADHFPPSPQGRWEQYLTLRHRLIPIEEHLATQYLSRPLLSVLRAQVQTRQFSTDTHRHIARVLRAVEVGCLQADSDHLALSHTAHHALTQVVDVIRRQPRDFPEWHSSDTAQLYNPPIFENEKSSKGYWF